MVQRKKKKVNTLKGARKKVVKKRISSKNKTKKIVLEVHKRFANYEERIDRLRELERELKILNPKGFSSEVKIIRSKLKDPSAVYEVERRMKKLKKEMINLPRRNSNIRKIQKKLAEVNVREIPKLHARINSIRKKLEEDEKRKSSDPGVSVLVEDRFNDFLKSLKQDLSKEEKEDERIFKNKLKSEFLEKERDLDISYRKKVQDIRDIYQKKVQLHLDKEVKEKFNSKLNKKLNKKLTEGKNKLNQKFDADEIRLNKRFNLDEIKLNKRFVLKKEKLEQELALKSKDILRKNLIEQRRVLRMQIHKEFNSRIQKKISEISSRTLKEKESYKKKIHLEDLRKLKENLNKETERIKRSLDKKYKLECKKNLEREKSKLNKEFVRKLDRLSREKSSFGLEKIKMKNKIFNDAKKKLKENMDRQREFIQANLEGEFNLKFRNNIHNEKVKLQKEFDLKERSVNSKLRTISDNFESKRRKVLEESRKQQEIIQEEKKDLMKELSGLKNKENLMKAQIELLKSQVEKEKELLKRKFDVM